jgi:hypothetical protein
MSCDTRQAYLRLADESGTQVRLLKMKPLDKPGRWSLILTLKPGNYHYRYYADDGQMTTYVSPRDADDSTAPMERLDAIRSVPAPSTNYRVLRQESTGQLVLS